MECIQPTPSCSNVIMPVGKSKNASILPPPASRGQVTTVKTHKRSLLTTTEYNAMETTTFHGHDWTIVLVSVTSLILLSTPACLKGLLLTTIPHQEFFKCFNLLI